MYVYMYTDMFVVVVFLFCFILAIAVVIPTLVGLRKCLKGQGIWLRFLVWGVGQFWSHVVCCCFVGGWFVLVPGVEIGMREVRCLCLRSSDELPLISWGCGCDIR